MAIKQKRPEGEAICPKDSFGAKLAAVVSCPKDSLVQKDSFGGAVAVAGKTLTNM